MTENERTLLTGDTVDAFETLEDDWDRFEFASYVAATDPDDRPEVDESDAAAALEWLERFETEQQRSETRSEHLDITGYDQWGPDDPQALAVLAAAIALRDANKFVPDQYLTAINAWIINNDLPASTYDLPDRTLSWWKAHTGTYGPKTVTLPIK